MLRVPTLCAGLLTIVSFWTTSMAGADPIRITAGGLTATGDSLQVSVELRSSPRDLVLTGIYGGRSVEGIFRPGDCQGTCQPGETLLLDARASAPSVSGAASIDGTTFPIGFGFGGPGGEASVDFTGSWMAPAFTGASSATVTSPFLFEGFLFYPEEFQRAADTMFGQGTATLNLLWASESAGWALERARYEFEDTAPIPEPGTLLLLGSGLAGMVVARRRRRTTITAALPGNAPRDS